MAIFSALLSMLSRKVGDLLQAVFGWAITGLFGRLSSAKQTALSVALVLAIAWPLLVVGTIFPGVAAWGLAFAPIHDFVSDSVLRIVWLALALFVPIVVGAIVRWVSPSKAKKGGVLRTLLSGYPLTLGFAASFLITLFVVPVLKLMAMAQGWSDDHVYVQVHEGKYPQVLNELERACAKANIELHRAPFPKAMGLATKVLKWFARGGLDPIVADDPQMLRGEGVALYLYPGDLLVRGEKERAARVRAALVRELTHASAYLTQEPVAQRIEDDLKRMWEVVARHHDEDELGPTAVMRVKEIRHDLEKAAIPLDQWTLLYANLHRLEREVCGGPFVVDSKADLSTLAFEVAAHRAALARNTIPSHVS